jgi:hypothetical protein
MADFGDLAKDAEKEASSHPQQADEAVKGADKEADQLSGGKDDGMIDKGAGEAEKALGGDGTNATPNAPAAPGSGS